ncbi:MAG: helix-turn-helix transcriptional regulator [Opitutaceae bacterium]
MPKAPAKFSALRALREKTGISQRELARQIGERQSNVSFWELTGTLPRSDKLAPIAQALGVTVEELLGAPKPKASGKPAGKAQQLFAAVSKLPRRQQEKIFDILRPFVREQAGNQPS